MCVCVCVCVCMCAANPIGIAIVQIVSPHIVSVVSKLPLLVSAGTCERSSQVLVGGWWCDSVLWEGVSELLCASQAD